MKYALVLLLACALGACGKSEDGITDDLVGNTAAANAIGTGFKSGVVNPDAAPAAPVALPAGVVAMQPGKWQTTVTITDYSISTAPGKKLPVPGPKTETFCLTAKDAAKGPQQAIQQTNSQFGEQCKFTTAAFEGGKINAAMRCDLPNGALTVNTTGSYTPTTMSSDAQASLTGKVSMTEKVHSEARLVGACETPGAAAR